MVPTFTMSSIDQVGAQLYPGSIATPTPQTFTVASPPWHTASELTTTTNGGHALHPGPYPPDLSRQPLTGLQPLVHSRYAPSGLASRTRTVWQYQPVPALSGPLPTLPGVPRIRLPPASTRPLRRPGGEVSHLHSTIRRLVAHTAAKYSNPSRAACVQSRSAAPARTSGPRGRCASSRLADIKTAS